MSDLTKEELQVLRIVFESVGYGFVPSKIIAEKRNPTGYAEDKRGCTSAAKYMLTRLANKGLVRQLKNQRPISWFITKEGAELLKKERGDPWPIRDDIDWDKKKMMTEVKDATK